MDFSVFTVRSTTETVGVGTRKAIPVSLPCTSGSTSPTALAAPVDDGMMLIAAPRPPFQLFIDGPSTGFAWRCSYVQLSSSLPLSQKFSKTTLVIGAKQLVVQDALERMSCSAESSSSFTPRTMVLTSPLAGAEIITFLAPAWM